MENNKEQDILLIKENTSKEIVYHYNRKERLAQQKRKKTINKKGLFRNKILLVIVCDIILIILIFVFVQSPFFNLLVKKKNTVMNIDEYHITLSGYRIKDKVFARLYIERVIEKENEKQDFISVLFSIEDALPYDKSSSFDKSLSYDKALSYDKDSSYIKEKLPNTVSEGINIQATLVAPDINKDLIAKVTIGKKTEILAFSPGER